MQNHSNFAPGGHYLAFKPLGAMLDQASRPRCKVHGAAAVAVQVAMALHPSALTKNDAKTP